MEFRRLGDGLVILREALADLGGTDADDRIFAGFVVRFAAEDFGADDALAEKVVLAGESVFDDVAQQGLALLGVAEGWAGQQVVEGRLDTGWVSGPGRLALVASRRRICHRTHINSEGASERGIVPPSLHAVKQQ